MFFVHILDMLISVNIFTKFQDLRCISLVITPISLTDELLDLPFCVFMKRNIQIDYFTHWNTCTGMVPNMRGLSFAFSQSVQSVDLFKE